MNSSSNNKNNNNMMMMMMMMVIMVMMKISKESLYTTHTVHTHCPDTCPIAGEIDAY